MKLKDLPNHHAVLLISSERDIYCATLFDELKRLSPAHRFFNHKVLDIDMARSIISWSQAPYNDEKIAIISFNTIGLEAQNALLKMLEEPKVGVRFILVTSNKTNLIDTVLSRLHVLERDLGVESLNDAEVFIATPSDIRMKLPFVVDIISQVEKINGKERKDKENIRLFVLDLVSVFENKNVDSKYIEETLEVASYVADPSSSGKALLEYLSLLLPVKK